MNAQFYVIFNMRNPEGDWLPFGKFYIGDNQEEARNLFSMLKHIPEVNESRPLTIEFVEIRDGLPFNLDLINCSLQQLEVNTRIITKELFRRRLCDVRQDFKADYK